MSWIWLFLLVLLANATVGILAPNMVCSVGATLLFVAVVVALFRTDPVSMSLLLPFVWLQFSVLLSLNAAESGAFMPEMGEAGHAVGAAVSYGLFSFLVIGAALAARRGLRRVRVPRSGPATPLWTQGSRPPSLLDLALFVFVLSCLGYLVFAGLRTGFPLLTHTDRFAYRRLDADVLTVDILDLQLLPALGLGVARLTTSSAALRALYGVLFAMLLVESSLFGDKFLILLLGLLAFLMPRMVADPDTLAATVLRMLPALLLGSVLMSAATLFVYSGYGALGLDEALTTLGNRISGQGELWYMTVAHDGALFRFDGHAAREVLASVFTRNPAEYMFEHRLGPYWFVERYAPPLIYHAVVDDAGAVTPTMANEAYALALFGYAGLVVELAATGLVVGALTVFIEREIRSGNPLRVLFPAFLLNATIKFFAQGTLFNIVSVPLFKSDAAFLLFAVVVHVLSRSAPAGTAGGEPVRTASDPGLVRGSAA